MAELKTRNILTPTEVKLFEEHFPNLRQEYKQTGKISLDSLIPIIGRPPIIPQSHDMDAMLEAMDARALYGVKAAQIENRVSLSKT